MQRKNKIKRIGRYWIDKSIIDEGYNANNVFESRDLRLELPELMDPTRRHKVVWLVCPVYRNEPSCSCCGWGAEQNEDYYRRPPDWVAKFYSAYC